jgi:hypothetical protein
MGIPPRPAFYLTVTLETPLALPVEGPLVTTEHVVYVPDTEWFNIGGVITDAADAPVKGAFVSLEPIGLRANTDEEGRFVFVKVAGGANYLLRAHAPGQTDVTRAIQVPEPSGNYELQFP